jgi:hypothetical protein
MKIWERHTTQEILESLEMELAKAQNELRCAESDVVKAKNRIAFVISAVHNLKDRDLQEKQV